MKITPDHNNELRKIDLQRLAEVITQIVWQASPDGAIEYLNSYFFTYTGLPETEAFCDAWLSTLHPDDSEPILQAWEKAIQHGENYENEHRIRGSDDMYRWFLIRGTALCDTQDNIVRWFGTCTEIDEQKRHVQIQDFLAESLSILSRSTGIPEATKAIANLAVQSIAEFCFFDILTAESQIKRIAWAYRDPHQAELSLSPPHPPSCSDELESRFTRTLLTGQAECIQGRQAEYPEILLSFISIPLLGRQEAIGILTLARTQLGDSFESADTAELEYVGRCVGLALETLKFTMRDRLVADRFQQAALPQTLPNVPGFTFSAVYQAAKSEAFVGGDWYDAFRLADGRIVISIGDVMGNGLDAAVTMGAVRQTIRGAAQIYPNPVTILNAADRALRAEQPNRIVTAFIGVLDPITLTIAYACAGHPPPMLRTRSGSIQVFIGSDLPLGLREKRHTEDAAHSIKITEASLLFFYTDGLIEATHDLFEGEERLRVALMNTNIFEVADPARAIFDAVLGHTDLNFNDSITDFSQDDIAAMAIRIDESSFALSCVDEKCLLRVHWNLDINDASAARTIRLEMVAALQQRGANDADICNAELLFSELIGNVIRHAGTNAEIILDLSTSAPVLHVLDHGPGFTFHTRLPHDVMSESGRGLFIAAMLTHEFSVTPRTDGGSHARIVLDAPLHPLPFSNDGP